MFDPKNRIHWVAVIVIALILILILGVTTAAGQEREAPVDPPRAEDTWLCGDGPTYAMRDVEPRLEQASALRDELLRLQAAERPDAGGRTLLWVCVMSTGRVGGILVHTTSRDPGLDSIALRVMADARYVPAESGGRAVTVWIAQPVDFVPRDVEIEL